MPKYLHGPTREGDPYSYLALSVIYQAFKDIKSYFRGDGTPEERKEGKKSVRWIKRMEGNFRAFAAAADMPLQEFHQLCLLKINEIKRKAYREKQRMAKKTSRKQKS